MNQNRIIEIIASVLEVSAAEINIESDSNSVESWDSMKQLFMVSELEQEFNIEFDTEEMEKMKSVRSIIDIINTKTS